MKRSLERLAFRAFAPGKPCSGDSSGSNIQHARADDRIPIYDM
jgi:hypothetical protein